MARSYGRISTSIWRDKDFRQLSPEARFTYTMLIGQPNITAAGVLELTARKWAGNTGYPLATIYTALDELAAHRYAIIDEETEELLIRSFARWDGGANNDLRRKAIKDAAEGVASDEIRASIADELDRLGVPHGLSIPPTGPINTRRVVVKEVSSTATPNRNPDPGSATIEREPEPSGDAGPLSPFCSEHQPNGTDKPCRNCATARTAFGLAAQLKLEDEVNTRRERATAIAACSLCDEKGIRLDPVSRQPAGRCDHASPAVSA